MSRLASLKQATSLSDLAALLNFKPSAVSYILYKQPQASKYTTFELPKRSGGQRIINAPSSRLKLLQQRLSDLLQDCLHEINGLHQRRDRIAHGFKRGRSIITNAQQHRNRRWVFNLDLEDFFPSINFGRVRGFFLKNRHFALQSRIATVIAQIACHGGSLPQGSPCSPVISNLIANVLDMRLVKLACEGGCTYSRYADDLTFSTNKKNFPPDIAVSKMTDTGQSHQWLPGNTLNQVIQRTGFRINTKKNRMMYRHSRQNVTGLVVNRKINVAWEYRHSVRAMVNRLITTGQFDFLKAIKQENGQIIFEKLQGRPNELHGRLGFIDSIDRSQTQTEESDQFSSRESTYRQFLFYTTFYAASAPVLICEGKTDNVYLTHAIRSLAREFPVLAEVVGDKTRLKIRIYKYPETSTARLLKLKSGGTGTLCKFISAYQKSMAHFRGPGLIAPVIVIYDSDRGAPSIRKAIKKVSNVPPIGTEPFMHIVRNLYAVPTPIEDTGKQSTIEDFFDDGIRGTVIDSKTFSQQNEFDPDTCYGKIVFAHKVIKPKAETINFKGFRPLLSNIVAAIIHHNESVPRPT